MQQLKTVATTIAILLIIGCNQKAEGQEKGNKSEAPEAVRQTFQKKYPGENDPDWHIDAHGNYESRFRIDGVRHRADFNPNGEWIETEVSIKKSELPKAIRKAIKENYPDEEIAEIERVQSASKGLFYDVEFKRKGKNMDIEYTKDGVKIN